MCKYFLSSALLLVCFLLIVFSDTCLFAAQNALATWWERVLPTLLPFSVFLSLSDSAGLFTMLERISRPIARKLKMPDALAPCTLFGMLAGYPNGARLCAMRGIWEDAAFCSFCSPTFLLGVIAHGLYGTKTVFFPLLLSHIAATVCFRPVFASKKKKARADVHSFSEKGLNFFAQLQHSLSIMASVGGCMVLFSIGTALIEQLHLLAPLAAVLRRFFVQEQHLLALTHGIFEFAGGCVSIAMLDISMRLRIALTAFTVTFGGLCVLMQTAMFLDPPTLQRYAKIKLLQGIAAAGIAYLLFPLFCTETVPVMLSTDASLQYASNAISLGSILFSSSTVLFSFYLFSLAICRYMQSPRAKT